MRAPLVCGLPARARYLSWNSSSAAGCAVGLLLDAGHELVAVAEVVDELGFLLASGPRKGPRSMSACDGGGVEAAGRGDAGDQLAVHAGEHGG
jgi:hypothetical protein